MANKRMFAMKIVDSDAFLDMPLSTQALYFHLNMRADDDGFIGNPKRIAKLINASEDDLKLLIAKRFILVFEDGVIVIKHWRMHNTIQKDRYVPTAYQDELNRLFIKNNKSYTLTEPMETKCIQNVSADIDKDIDIELGLNKELNKEIDSNKNIESNIYAPSNFLNCSEPPIIGLSLNDNSIYEIYQKDINEWQELYQSVDILQELKKMKGWLNANPKKRKTKSGIKRFINAWLSREQDKSHLQTVIPKEKETQLKITVFDVEE